MCRTCLTDRVETATAAASKAGLIAGVYRILERNEDIPDGAFQSRKHPLLLFAYGVEDRIPDLQVGRNSNQATPKFNLGH